MSAAESSEVEHVASVTALPSRVTPDPAPSLSVQHLPSFAQVAELVTPPDIWSDKRPSLRDIWLYARYGNWTHKGGLLRILGCIDAFALVLPPHAVGYTFLWIWERPSRRFVAVTIGTLIYLTLH